MNFQKKIEDAIQKDKLMHFCVGLLLAQLMYFSLWLIFIPAIVGFTKEVYDKYIRKTGFNWWDLFTTILGIVPVLVVLVLLHLIKG